MEIKRINKQEVKLVADLFNKYRVFYKQPSDMITAKKFIQSRLDNNESIILVAFEPINDRKLPVGFTQLYPAYSSVRAIKYWILNDLYVEIDHRKKGIGEKLIQTAMDFAKKDGAAIVELSTAIDNYTAQTLYENIGFEKQKAAEGYFTYQIKLSR
ncbi:MAG TPA: GNAT family N-acetyltransferase [Ferruginibacter sp.]|jgi:ribosomal protein S18 acetylase RimI-like enzyme|nr:GNAT family N-acetyltransferase [Ferruginibacter sp.]